MITKTGVWLRLAGKLPKEMRDNFILWVKEQSGLTETGLVESVDIIPLSLVNIWLLDKYGFYVEVIWYDTLSNHFSYHVSSTGNGIRSDSDVKIGYERTFELGLEEAIETLLSY